MDVLVSLPLAVPPVVVGYLLLLVLGNNGPVGGLLSRYLGLEVVFTWFAAALAAAVVSFPADGAGGYDCHGRGGRAA